jgi:hypothetical protein
MPLSYAYAIPTLLLYHHPIFLGAGGGGGGVSPFLGRVDFLLVVGLEDEEEEDMSVGMRVGLRPWVGPLKRRENVAAHQHQGKGRA